MTRGLLQMSGVVIDFVNRVERLPESGGEVESASAFLAAGGGFNALAAARRLGADAAYGAALGVGPFADIARSALASENVELMQRRRLDVDQGVCVVLVEANGERSFVSHHGAERRATLDDLTAVPAASFAWILLSGYAVQHPLSADVYARWLRESPREPRVLFDPGPVVAHIGPEALAAALARADWVSVNRREARALTGLDEPAAAAQALAASREGAIVRDGAAGCWIALADEAAAPVEGFAVDAVDTTGAGDTHDGAFIAFSLAGLAPRAAARLANAAAAISVTRHGPATGPTSEELVEFLGSRPMPRAAAEFAAQRLAAALHKY